MIIDRNILHKDLLLHCNDKVYTREKILDDVDRAKKFLVEKYDAKPGQKVILTTNNWPKYLIWFLAISELGMSFVISDYPRINNSRSVQQKLSLYGDIDFLISRKEDLFDCMVDLSRNVIDDSIIYDLPPASFIPSLAKPDDILIYATSSGTTATPKVVSHTHRFFKNLLHRNAKILGLQEHDRCLHTKGMHHGSVTGVYMLPTLAYCKYHYQVGFLNKDKWVEVLQKEKINRFLSFYDGIDAIPKGFKKENQIHDDLTIYVLSAVQPETINCIVRDFGYRIVSIFGCTETSGPVFLSEVNPQNLNDYDLTVFSGPLDDFYDIQIKDELLHVGMPDGSVVVTGDRFEIDNSKWVFKGRENLFRINDRAIYLNLIINLLETKWNIKNKKEFDIIFDAEKEKIYVRLDFPIDLDLLNDTILDDIGDSDYKISCAIIGFRDDFFTGIKFDENEIRLRCREKLKIY